MHTHQRSALGLTGGDIRAVGVCVDLYQQALFSPYDEPSIERDSGNDVDN